MGFVERSPGSYDKRVQQISLTKEGDGIVKKIEGLLFETGQLIIDQIELEEQEHISSVLERLVWSMDCIREE